MKKSSALIPVALLAFAAFSSVANAQTFGLSTLVTTDTDVLTNGTTALAFDFFDLHSGSSTTVNTVKFSGNQTQNGISLSFTGFPNSGNNGVVQTLGMSTQYADILLFNSFQTNTPASFSLNNLIAGDTYELQLFDGSSFVGGTEKVTDGTSSGALAYTGSAAGTVGSGAAYITETFTAGANGTETIGISTITNQYEIVNAVNLRDLGVVPEPSTTALMFLGMTGLGALTYRLRKSAMSL